MTTVGSVAIERRYRGPTESGNGGYVCGLVAAFVGDPAEVTLRVPPPLERDLAVEALEDGSVRLVDGGTVVAEARAATLSVDVPAPVSFEEASDAGARSPLREVPTRHAFPECFTCGPKREAGDGLRVIPGPVDGRDELAADTWTPHGSLAGDDGTVPAEIVWAALDCTSYFGGSVRQWMGEGDAPPYVLGRLAASIHRRPVVGERLVAMGWPEGADDRKLFAASAVVDADGETLGIARATWIRIG